MPCCKSVSAERIGIQKLQPKPCQYRNIKGNRKGFYSHSSNKRKTGENVGLLPNVAGDQVMECTEKDNLVKDSMSSLSQPLLAKAAAHFQAFQVFAQQQCTTHSTEGSNQVQIRSAGHMEVHRTGQDASEGAGNLA